MKLLKKSQPQKEASTEVSSLADLKNRLVAAQAAAEAYVEKFALAEKAASPLQPLEWHRLNTRLRFGRDAVECALALMDQEKK